MKIHAITVVKNEADILRHTLAAGLEWADAIYVLDNGSTDGTWELLQGLAASSPNLILCGQDPQPFRDGMRGAIYQRFQTRSTPGDWWCKLDADDLYVDDPRRFLERVPPAYSWVWSTYLNYFFTDRDLERWEDDPSLYGPEVPPDQKLRYYLNTHSERRFVRDPGALDWPEDEEWPLGLHRVYPRMIRQKNFVYRSPDQIQARLETRYAAIQAAFERGNDHFFQHEQITNWVDYMLKRAPAQKASRPSEAPMPTWRDRIMPAEALDYDDGTDDYVLRPELARQPPPGNRLAYGVRSTMHTARRLAGLT
jgi:glycosyltransferase involved in cell wall biosynthesis